MRVAFICKAFEDAVTWLGDENSAKQIRFIDVDKLTFGSFNRRVYDQEINDSLATSFFLRLPEYNIP